MLRKLKNEINKKKIDSARRIYSVTDSFDRGFESGQCFAFEETSNLINHYNKDINKTINGLRDTICKYKEEINSLRGFNSNLHWQCETYKVYIEYAKRRLEHTEDEIKRAEIKTSIKIYTDLIKFLNQLFLNSEMIFRDNEDFEKLKKSIEEEENING